MNYINNRFYLWLVIPIALIFAPLLLSGYAITLLTLIFLFTFLGQAWNLSMGYAGVLSLGHALFFGVGGYAAAILSEKFGIIPWIGIPIAGLLAAMIGAFIAWLGFRFAVKGVYFALMTIAFAEFTRILFDHWEYVGASGGFFLKKLSDDASELVQLRGSSTIFYYGFLSLAVLSHIFCRWMINGKLGYFWRALREDPDAAQALGVDILRMKMLNVSISAFLTGVGGALFALMNGSLFPDTMFGMAMSIEMIIAPIVGGLGTLSGAFVGALIVIPIRELSNEIGLMAGIFGLNTFVYGLLVLGIVTFAPQGVGPKLGALFSFKDSKLVKEDKPRA